MYRSSGLTCVVLLTACSMAQAQDTTALFDIPESGVQRWHNVGAEMTPDEYDRACKQNIRNARHALKGYTNEIVSALHIPETGAKVMGAAAALAAGNASVPLDDRRFMALEFDDVTGNDRAMYLRFKVDW